MMKDALISVIVPCYKQVQYLNECLQSILNQSYQNWECIIVNDGSPDNTQEIAIKWTKKDTRFKYIYKENGGLSSSRNIGLDVSKGDYIQFLDCDDVIDSEKFMLSITAAKNTDRESIIVSHFKLFQNDKLDDLKAFCELNIKLLNFESILYGWDYEFNIPIHCGIFSSSLFTNFRFPEQLKAREDWIMWLKIFSSNPEVVFIDNQLAYYRYHEKSMTKDYIHMKSNFFNSLSILKTVISEDEYQKFLIFLVEKYYQKSSEKEFQVKKYKNSGSYKLGSKIKNILHNLHLLSSANWVLKKLKK